MDIASPHLAELRGSRMETTKSPSAACQAWELSEQAGGLVQLADVWRSRWREEERARTQVTHRLTIARRDLYAANLRADRAEAALAEALQQRDEALQQRDAILMSRTWRLLGPGRRFARRYPWLSRLGWRMMRLAWWTVTLQLPRRYREWRASVQYRVLPADQ
jgi:hypothetical protein